MDVGTSVPEVLLIWVASKLANLEGRRQLEKLAIDRRDERGPRQPSGVVGLDIIHLSLLGYFQTPFPPRIGGQWLSCVSCNSCCPLSGCPST